jgi:hypothetical protein
MLDTVTTQDLEKIYEYIYKLDVLNHAEKEHTLPDGAYNLKSKLEQTLGQMLDKTLDIMCRYFRFWSEMHIQDLTATTIFNVLSDKERDKSAAYQRNLIKKHKKEFLEQYVYTDDPDDFDSWFWSSLLIAIFKRDPKIKNKVLGKDSKGFDKAVEDQNTRWYVDNFLSDKYGPFNQSWNIPVFSDPAIKSVLLTQFDTIIDSLENMVIFHVMPFLGTDQKLIDKYEKKMLDAEKEDPEDPEGPEHRFSIYITVQKALNDMLSAQGKDLSSKIKAFNIGLTTAHNNGAMAEGFIEGAENIDIDVPLFLENLSNKDVSKWDADLKKVLWKDPYEIEEDVYFQPESFLRKAIKLLLA